MQRRQHFAHTPLPYLLLAPQIVIIAVFFIYPAAQAIYLSFMLEDPWGLSSTFVWFENYQVLFSSTDYLDSLGFTLLFSVIVSFLSLALALLLAVKADNIIHGQGSYRVTLTWVYAVAPAVAGIIGGFLFNPHIGVLTDFFQYIGWQFSFQTDPVDATIALILVSVWKQVSVNFLRGTRSGAARLPKRQQTLLEHHLSAARPDGIFPVGDQPHLRFFRHFRRD